MELGQSRLTPQQIKEFEEAFHLFDEDGDGALTLSELRNALKSIGQLTSEKDLQRRMKELDTDKSGQIELNEFLIMIESFMRSVNDESEIRNAFNLFDTDNDGFLTARDLVQIMQNMGERITILEARAMVDEADKDGDGKISYKDFYDILTER